MDLKFTQKSRGWQDSGLIVIIKRSPSKNTHSRPHLHRNIVCHCMQHLARHLIRARDLTCRIFPVYKTLTKMSECADDTPELAHLELLNSHKNGKIVCGTLRAEFPPRPWYTWSRGNYCFPIGNSPMIRSRPERSVSHYLPNTKVIQLIF